MTTAATPASGYAHSREGASTRDQNRFRVRWLGHVPYRDAWALQRALHRHSPDDHLLLLEHPHVFTVHRPADIEHVLVSPADVGAELVRTDRGGDVTYHGPGQLVGYPIVTVPTKRPGGPSRRVANAAGDGASKTASRRAGMGDTVTYVRSIEQLIIDVLGDLGLPNVGRLDRYPGVWVDPESDTPRKICAIGVRITKGRSLHGFALNVAPDMRYWSYIVPCGITDEGKGVTSLAEEGLDVPMQDVITAITARAPSLTRNRDGNRPIGAVSVAVSGMAKEPEVQQAAWRHVPKDLSAFTRSAGGSVSVQLRSRMAQAGVTEGLSISQRKPDWLRSEFKTAPNYLKLKHTMRNLDLVTVCEEAGCPNIYDCWADGTATFMINGERCTRACGFCLVDTRRPEPLNIDEPERVAEAVERMGLQFAVVTAVARDDLPDGGGSAFAETIRAIRQRTPGVQVEVLIPDCKGDEDALGTIFDARPDVLNHNLETVLRLQRVVRPSAGYARSLSVLARAKEAGLTTKSGLIVGMGETDDEVLGALADLRGVGVDIVTIGQYLRPTASHLPVTRWVEPATFDEYARAGMAMGIPHVESSPLTRSSYHARQASEAATLSTAGSITA